MARVSLMIAWLRGLFRMLRIGRAPLFRYLRPRRHISMAEEVREVSDGVVVLRAPLRGGALVPGQNIEVRSAAGTRTGWLGVTRGGALWGVPEWAAALLRRGGVAAAAVAAPREAYAVAQIVCAAAPLPNARVRLRAAGARVAAVYEPVFGPTMVYIYDMPPAYRFEVCVDARVADTLDFRFRPVDTPTYAVGGADVDAVIALARAMLVPADDDVCVAAHEMPALPRGI
jgi:hypothetical protein